MRVFYRLPALALLILLGLGAATLIRLLGPQRLRPGPIAAWWSQLLLKLFNIRPRFHGEANNVPQLQVANHISWLDMFVLATRGHYRYVAKSEVARWPVASTLANAMGTVYIRRGRGGAAPVLEQTRPLLKAGGFFLFFPEGTTTDGSSVLPFHARLFEAAVDAGCIVQPIALRYDAVEGGRNVAPYIGDDTLVAHIWRLLKNPGLSVDVHYCPALPAGPRAQALAADAQRAIEARIGLPAADDAPASAVAEAA